MSEHIPPTEAELEECRRTLGAVDHHLVVRMATEIRHLRAVCGTEARNVYELRNVMDWDEVREYSEECAERLRAASEGRK